MTARRGKRMNNIATDATAGIKKFFLFFLHETDGQSSGFPPMLDWTQKRNRDC